MAPLRMVTLLTTKNDLVVKTAAIRKKTASDQQGAAQPQSRQPVGSVGPVSLVRQIR